MEKTQIDAGFTSNIPKLTRYRELLPNLDWFAKGLLSDFSLLSESRQKSIGMQMIEMHLSYTEILSFIQSSQSEVLFSDNYNDSDLYIYVKAIKDLDRVYMKNHYKKLADESKKT